MRWLLTLADEAPKLTQQEWAELQQEQMQQQLQQFQGAFLGPLWIFWVIELLWGALTLWMVIYCIRNDSERSTWLWILLFFPGVGPIIYFFSRWLPSSSFELPTFLKRWTEGGKIRRLEVAAQQIGNPYQFIELGDALKDTRQCDRAAVAYEKAVQKEPHNLPALWGLASVRSQLGQTAEAKTALQSVLQADPGYKFGDVSLLYGRTLHALPDREAELAHWRSHIKRWRQPEALYTLAQVLIERREYAEARQLLQTMISNIEITPRGLAKKVFFWKGRGKKLLRTIPTTS